MSIFPFADAQLEQRISMVKRELDAEKNKRRRQVLAEQLKQMILKRSENQVRKMEKERGLA